MEPRKRITVTLLVCLLVSSPVWAQGERLVCPCWTAEELEEAVSAQCLDPEISSCGLGAQLVQLFCGGFFAASIRRQEPSEPFANMATTSWLIVSFGALQQSRGLLRYDKGLCPLNSKH
jgi:hypothetical protein